MFVLREGDTVILENDNAYMVYKTIELNGEGYLIIGPVGVDLKTLLGIKGKVKIVQEFVDDDENYYLEAVTDLSILEKIKAEVNREA